MLELGVVAGNRDMVVVDIASVGRAAVRVAGTAVADKDTAVALAAPDTVAVGMVSEDTAAADTPVFVADMAVAPLEFHTEPAGTEAGTVVVLAPDSRDIAVEAAGWCP